MRYSSDVLVVKLFKLNNHAFYISRLTPVDAFVDYELVRLRNGFTLNFRSHALSSVYRQQQEIGNR